MAAVRSPILFLLVIRPSPFVVMPAALTPAKLLAGLSWGVDDKPIESTTEHAEAGRQLEKLIGSTNRWSETDIRLTREVHGVSVTQARDKIRAKMREAVAQGRASRRSKHEDAIIKAEATADVHEAVAKASSDSGDRLLCTVAKYVEENKAFAHSSVVAQRNTIQLAKELHMGEPDEDMASEEEAENEELCAAASTQNTLLRTRATAKAKVEKAAAKAAAKASAKAAAKTSRR